MNEGKAPEQVLRGNNGSNSSLVDVGHVYIPNIKRLSREERKKERKKERQFRER